MTETQIQPWEYCCRCLRALGTIARLVTMTVVESWCVGDHAYCWECYKVYRDEQGDPIPPPLYRMTAEELLAEYRKRGLMI